MNPTPQALHGWVLLARDDRERESPGGILIPGTATKVANRGKVISAGKHSISQEGYVVPTEVVPGDVVMFAPNNIRPAQYKKNEYDRTEYVFVPSYSILAKIEED